MNNLANPILAKKLYSSALRAAKKKSFDKKKTSTKLLVASKLGSAEATYALASWYLNGTHFDQNIPKGIRLLKAARKAGVASACFDLAYSFEVGAGVTKNLEQAFQLYMEASMRGDEESTRHVARCLWHGIGTMKNRALADLWGQKIKKERK
jgi:uncharacterized protein